jgi:hypothetical protein
MDTATLLIIIIVILVLAGGGWYGCGPLVLSAPQRKGRALK